MTPRELWLAAARMQPVDRLPFWPKLDAAYPRAQRPPFCNMELDEIHDWIGSDKHVGAPTCTKDVRTRTSSEVVTNDHVKVERFHSPSGTLELKRRFDEGSQSWHPVSHPVQCREDIEFMADWFNDCRVELDHDCLDTARRRVEEVGDSASTKTSIGTSALMHWVEHLAGVETAHLLLADYPDETEALFEAIHRMLLRRAEILADKWPGDMIYSTENTSTTLISPDQYQRFNVRHIREYGRIITGAGRIFTLHMCGHLKAILPALASLPVTAFEAFTSPTLGNTTLLDGRTQCPDTCLIGGTNATLWTQSAEDIIAQLEADLDALPHHRGIVVTSAGVMTPLCPPETIRTVCEWVKSIEPRM
jgi:uroporphyrinogen-III decarboxylase